MITIDKIQAKIAEAIKQCGISQTQLAKELCVSKQAVSHYLSGTKLPALDTLANLCDYLGLDANDILCINE